jgi:transglutaminase-like putative cysteine protease
MPLLYPSSARSLITFLLLLLVAATARGEEATTEKTWQTLWEHWYVLEIDDAPAGWFREEVRTDGELYETHHEQQLSFSRGAETVSVGGRNVFRETIDGRLLELSSVIDMGQQPVETTWCFHEDHVEATTRQGGRLLTRRLDRPEEPWFSPMAAHRFVLDQLRSGAEEFSYRTMEPENGLEPVVTTHVFQGRDELEFEDQTLPVTVWTTTSSIMPRISATSMFTSDGHLVRDEVRMPIGRLVTRLVPAEEAQRALDGAAPELMVQTFVAVDRPIARPRQATRARLRLRVQDGQMPDLPSAGAQRVEAGEDPATAVLVVDVADPLPAPAEDIDDKAYRDPSSMVDSSDALVSKLASRAIRSAGDDPRKQAEAMRAFVHRHINAKALDTAFATASETAKMRTGDCSEHGVLLCAMLRSQGIPARVATGLVYADSFAGERDIFGWHMWTQALIDGRWTDLDATLTRPYDAAHVLVGTSSLADGAPGTELAAMLSLLGNLEIEVLEVE